MGRINLNESYLHNVIMSSIGNLIKEDMGSDLINYLDDIKKGTIDEIECKDGDVTINVIGASDTYHIDYDDNKVMAFYTIKCYARRDETSAGSSGDYYNPPEPSEYDDYLEIQSVLFSNNYKSRAYNYYIKLIFFE